MFVFFQRSHVQNGFPIHAFTAKLLHNQRLSIEHERFKSSLHLAGHDHSAAVSGRLPYGLRDGG